MEHVAPSSSSLFKGGGGFFGDSDFILQTKKPVHFMILYVKIAVNKLNVYRFRFLRPGVKMTPTSWLDSTAGLIISALI